MCCVGVCVVCVRLCALIYKCLSMCMQFVVYLYVLCGSMCSVCVECMCVCVCGVHLCIYVCMCVHKYGMGDNSV